MPRITITPEDSLFCASFFHKLHTIETPNFSSLQYYDRVVKDVFPVVYCATDHEAGCLGIFLKATFEPLKRWRFDKHLYEKEAASKPGFSVAIGSPARCSYEQYCTVFFKWYDKITKIALHCLDQYEDHGRACLLVLIKLDGVYPARKRVNALLMDKLDIIRKQEDMKDVQAMAQRYHTLLKKRKDSLFDDVVSKRDVPNPKSQNVNVPSKRQADSTATKQASPDRNKSSSAVSDPSQTGPTEAAASTPSSLIPLKYDMDSSMLAPSGNRGARSSSIQKESYAKEHTLSLTCGSTEALPDVLMRSNPSAVGQTNLQGVQSRSIRATTMTDSKTTRNAGSRGVRSNRDELDVSTSVPHRNRIDTLTHVHGRAAERVSDRKKYAESPLPSTKPPPSPSGFTKPKSSTQRLDQHPKRTRNDDTSLEPKRNRSVTAQSSNDRPPSKRNREEERRRGGGRR